MEDFKIDHVISESSLLINPQDLLADCSKDYSSIFGNAKMDISVPVFQPEENRSMTFSSSNNSCCDFFDYEDESEKSCNLTFEC